MSLLRIDSNHSDNVMWLAWSNDNRLFCFHKSAWRSAVLRAAWGVWLVAVVIGSLLPADAGPMVTIDALDINDKVEHLIGYLLLACLPAIYERRRVVVVLLLLLPVLGIALEIGQLYSPGRSFDAYDMLADVGGVISGTILGLALRRSVLRRLVYVPVQKQVETVSTVME